MGQSEVYEYLKEHSDKWFNSIELSKALNVKVNVVNRAFVNLRRFNLIYRKLGEIKYKDKRRMIYYYQLVPENKSMKKGALGCKDELVEK